MNRYKRTSALPAIAAALALSSTPVLAQEVQPVPTDPAPAAQPAPTLPTTDTAPATDTTPVAQPDMTAADSAAPAASAKPPARHSAAKAAPKAPRTVARATPVRSTTTRTAATAPAPAAKVTPAAAPAPAPVSHRPQPLVNLSATPATPTAAVAPKPVHKKKDATLPIAGGALAFLAIGGAAAAMTRRRHDDEEEWVEETPMTIEPEDPPMATDAEGTPVAEQPVVYDEQPTIVAPAAFAWDGAEQANREGESYVERAYRGPTPENPSLSLKKRLKRAAVLDKRERDVAEGKAEPMDPMAGLPEAMADEQEQREFDHA